MATRCRNEIMPQYTETANNVAGRIARHAPNSTTLATQQYAWELAGAVAEHMNGYIATNNEATWDNTSRAQVTTIATALDNQETNLLRRVTRDPSDERDGWMVESGLMATLVGANDAGNCDDLASYAAHLCLTSATRPITVCYTNGNGFQHSFVLLQSGANYLVQLDCWVAPYNRVTFWNASTWRNGANQEDTFTLSIENVGSNRHPGLIAAWDDFAARHRRPRARALAAETPRTGQVGSYFHDNAAVRPLAMSERGNRRTARRSASPEVAAQSSGSRYPAPTSATDYASLLAGQPRGRYSIGGVTIDWDPNPT